MTELLNDDVVKLVYCRNIKGNETGVRFPARDRRRRIARKAANARWDMHRFIIRMQILVLNIQLRRRPLK
jgi:hypothetical protein